MSSGRDRFVAALGTQIRQGCKVLSIELATRTSLIGGSDSSAWLATESKAVAIDASMIIQRKQPHGTIITDDADLTGATPISEPAMVESIKDWQSVERDTLRLSFKCGACGYVGDDNVSKPLAAIAFRIYVAPSAAAAAPISVVVAKIRMLIARDLNWVLNGDWSAKMHFAS